MWSVSEIAVISGATEESIYLMISLLISFPICLMSNKIIANKSKSFKLLFHLSFGFVLIYFNFGFNLFHSLFVCLFCYTIITYFSPKTSIVVNTTVPMVYLLYGCYLTQIGSNYSISWTVPQCVLTLRLIAITFDIYDGQRNDRVLKNRDKYEKTQLEALMVNTDSAVESMPTLLEFLSHCYFPASILVGPLIPYRKFIHYIESNVDHMDSCMASALKRLCLGLIYLAIYQIGSNYWPMDYLVTDHFTDSGFWYKMTAMAVVTKVSMTKYLSSWLISEAACIASGVSWDGKSYYSCANIHVYLFETTPTLGGVIKSFNLTTNSFAAKYVFKRLKFMGNKTISQALTLLFLAVWHGLSSGYFATFLMEFLLMKLETEVLVKVNHLRLKNQIIDQLLNTFVVKSIVYIFFRFYTIYMLGYSFTPFMLLQFPLWFPVWAQVYFVGHILTLSWILINLIKI